MNKVNNPNLTVIIAVFLVLGAAVFLAVYGTLPSKIEPEGAPATEFLASRAMRHIELIASEPRPTGTEGNLRAREYILEQLTQMGLEPEIQRITVCGHYPKSWCANPNNILAKISGTESSDAIVLVAHYDSQQFCPCASDDAYGVAVLLETARALLAGPPLKNTVILLFTDAHEWNFQGAAAFVTQHPWAQQVKLVFSYDGSSSWGPASMVFYDPHTAWIIRELAHMGIYGIYPFTSSLVNSIYKDYPGGDLNAFQRHGYYGFEAGCWPSVYYHSSLDNIEKFMPAGLQQQGSIAVAMVAQFGDKPLNHQLEPFPIYFNLLRLALVVYPASWVLPITALITIGYAGILLVGLKRRRLTWSGIGLSVLAFLVGLLASIVSVWILFKAIPLIAPLYNTRFTSNWEGFVYNQPWLAAAFACITIGIEMTIFLLMRRSKEINRVDCTMGVQGILLVGLLAISFAAPGTSYLLAWPLLFSLFAPAYWILTEHGMENPLSMLPLLGVLTTGVAAIMLLFPMIMAAYIGLSLSQAFIPTILLAVLLGLLTPCITLISERRCWWPLILAGFTTLGILVPLLSCNFNAQRPHYFDLFYVLDADQEKALWATSSPQNENVLSMLFPQGTEEMKINGMIIDTPFDVADAPQISLLAPQVELIEDKTLNDIRTVHLRFSSRRGASILYVMVTNPDLTFHSVTVNGIMAAIPLNQDQVDVEKLILPDGVEASDLWKYRPLFYFEGLESGETIDIIFEVDAGESVDLIVLDSSYGLPAASAALLKDLPDGIQLGHAETTVYTTVSLGDSR